ncbi:2-haloacid dehalogenase [Faunimonas pinastri]|uniref:2-haloacid dehalogenase n=1 Tax=Faunimonas pinastri TaxID=1855383 RepID=A0A1H8ZQI0_9HYPH|nr:HAD family phosphatase [Faunimonas pinastri]SEP66746.1 2-haloacid dehalogenase [Faunimonas pinastri]
MNEIRHIVFDIGNVLLHWERERPYRRLIPDAVKRRHFLTEICSDAWHHRLDEGVPVDEAIAELVARHPEHEDLIRAYKTEWLEMLPGAIGGTVEILERLVADGRDVTALTNFNQDLFQITVPEYPFLRIFRGVTVSGEKRLIKPDPAIYEEHARAFGLEPSATLFFDDMERNVAAARAAGWNAEVFTDPEGLRRDLARYGIAI